MTKVGNIWKKDIYTLLKVHDFPGAPKRFKSQIFFKIDNIVSVFVYKKSQVDWIVTKADFSHNKPENIAIFQVLVCHTFFATGQACREQNVVVVVLYTRLCVWMSGWLREVGASSIICRLAAESIARRNVVAAAISMEPRVDTHFIYFLSILLSL